MSLIARNSPNHWESDFELVGETKFPAGVWRHILAAAIAMAIELNLGYASPAILLAVNCLERQQARPLTPSDTLAGLA